MKKPRSETGGAFCCQKPGSRRPYFSCLGNWQHGLVLYHFVLVLFSLAFYAPAMTTVLNTTIRMDSLRGRGALSNQMGRYEKQTRFLVDDGWDDGWRSEDATPPPIRTEVLHDATRSIIARNQSPDISFDQSINPYRGCEHGCIYCFARPSHAYLGLSPGVDFESRLFAKPNAADLLARELSAPGYVPKVIAMGTNTDPYQPLEKKLRITRSILEVLRDFRHPVAIVTKSPLILRDLDILSEMAEMGLAKAALSITTLDRKLARAMEPRAGTPARRLQAIRGLAEAGVPAGVMFAPAIPALNDHEMEAILSAAKEAGARSAGYVLLRLPMEIKDLFREWLEIEAPGRAKHVMALVRSMRGGKDYDSQWNTRMRGIGPYAEMMARRFRMAVKRLELNLPSKPMAINSFRRPPRIGDQLSLL
jgi:DNA repair photolyase